MILLPREQEPKWDLCDGLARWDEEEKALIVNWAEVEHRERLAFFQAWKEGRVPVDPHRPQHIADMMWPLI